MSSAWTPRIVACISMVGFSVRVFGIDEEHRQRGAEIARKAVAFLASQQDAATGGWSIPGEGPKLPAITALVLNGMLLDPGARLDDPAVARGVEFLLASQRPDGGIYDVILPSYNTAISISALARVDRPEARAAVDKARGFLRTLQYGEEARPDPANPEAPNRVGPDNPFYGGVGYGKHGRPDLSNTGFVVQALHDSGVGGEDPAMRRALVFLQRCQMLDEANDMTYANGSRQGGFIYATSENGVRVGVGQSQTDPSTIEETLDDGSKVSRLRAYGSMTYTGFKSYIFAELPRDDIRVTAAYDWIRRHYTLEENPGAGTDGLYYYFVTFARALDAWGEPTVMVLPAEGSAQRTVEPRDWANDLVDRLSGLQNEDGSFKSVDNRWMEDNPVLITAYALIAVQHAVRDEE